MKILIVTPKYYPDTFPVNLIAEGLASRGHEVDVLTTVPFINGEYIKEYEKEESIENGVKVYRVKSFIRTKKKSSLVKNYYSIYKAFKRWVKKCDKKYDLVYSYSVSPVVSLVAGNLYKKKYNVPHIVHALDIWPESVVDAGYTSVHSLLYKVLLKWSKKEYQGADTLLIGSHEFESYLKEVIKLKDKEIKFLIQPGFVYKNNNDNNPYDTKKTNILYCGNISKLQLVNYIVPAMKKLDKENVVFNIVGTGSYLDELKQEIKDSGLTNVIYHGYFNYQDSSKFLKNADCFFISLKDKGIVGKTIPNKVITSLYYSIPIIGMIGGEGKEILAKNSNIIIEDSIDGLVEGINKFLSLSKKEIEEIANKNRQCYDDNYSFDKIIENLLSSFPSK